METYKIICSTDPYHASRNVGFSLNEKRTKGVKVMDEGLSLKKARKKLLEYFCQDAERWFPNWGVATGWSGDGADIVAFPTRTDGTRAYREDIYTYEIVEEEK